MEKRYKIPKLTILLLFLSTVLYYSCFKDYLDIDKLSTHVQTHSLWSVPVAIGTLTVNDLKSIKDGNQIVESNENGLIVLKYVSELVTLTADKLFNVISQDIPPITLEHTLGKVQSFSQNPKTEDIQIFDDNDYDIQRIIFEKALMDIKISSKFNVEGELEIIIDSLKGSDNKGFSKKISLQRNGSFESTENLDKNSIGLVSKSGKKNILAVTLKFTPKAGQVPSPGDNLEVKLIFHKNLTFDWLFGDVKNDQPKLSDTSRFKIYIVDNVLEGEFYVQNPTIKFNFENTFGTDVKFGMDYLTAIYDIKGFVDPVSGFPVYDKSPRTIPKAKKPANLSEKIEPMEDSMLMKDFSTNFKDVVYQLPNHIDYCCRYAITPEGTGNFIHSSSKLKIMGDIDLPLEGYTKNLKISQLIKFNLSETINAIEGIKSITLTIDTKNGFPIDFYGEVFLTDKDTVKIDKLELINPNNPNDKSATILTSGIIGSNGKIDQKDGKTRKLTSITVDDVDRINSWKNATYLLYNAYIKTKDNDKDKVVYFYENYNIDVRVTADVEILVDKHFNKE